MKLPSAPSFGLLVLWVPVHYLTGGLLNDTVLFWKLSYRYVEEGRQWLSDIAWKMDWSWRTNRVASTVVGSKSYRYFPMEIRSGIYCVYAVPPRPIEDLVARFFM